MSTEQKIRNRSVRLPDAFPLEGAEIADFMSRVLVFFRALRDKKVKPYFEAVPEMKDYLNRLSKYYEEMNKNE